MRGLFPPTCKLQWINMNFLIDDEQLNEEREGGERGSNRQDIFILEEIYSNNIDNEEDWRRYSQEGGREHYF